MNTQHKPIKVVQCIRCPDVFMTVGSTKIGLAFPRPVSMTEHGNAIGICPRHPVRALDQER